MRRAPGATRPARASSALLLAAATLLASPAAQADGRELYTLVEAAPAVVVLNDIPTGKATTTRVGFTGGVAAYYGLTNSLHVGLGARVTLANDASFPNLTVSQEPAGTFYENMLGVGADAVVAYRLDTGGPLAPVCRLQIGAAYHLYSAQQLVLDPQHAVPYPDLGQLVAGAQVSVALEYRLGDRIVGSAGLAARYNFSGASPFQFSLPVTVGVVW